MSCATRKFGFIDILMKACKTGNLNQLTDCFNQLVKMRHNPSIKESFLEVCEQGLPRAACVAAEYNNYTCLQFLLDKGVCLNCVADQSDGHGNDADHAAASGHLHCLQFLYKQNLRCTDIALRSTAQSGSLDIFIFIMNAEKSKEAMVTPAMFSKAVERGAIKGRLKGQLNDIFRLEKFNIPVKSSKLLGSIVRDYWQRDSQLSTLMKWIRKMEHYNGWNVSSSGGLKTAYAAVLWFASGHKRLKHLNVLHSEWQNLVLDVGQMDDTLFVDQRNCWKDVAGVRATSLQKIRENIQLIRPVNNCIQGMTGTILAKGSQFSQRRPFTYWYLANSPLARDGQDLEDIQEYSRVIELEYGEQYTLWTRNLPCHFQKQDGGACQFYVSYDEMDEIVKEVLKCPLCDNYIYMNIVEEEEEEDDLGCRKFFEAEGILRSCSHDQHDEARSHPFDVYFCPYCEIIFDTGCSTGDWIKYIHAKLITGFIDPATSAIIAQMPSFQSVHEVHDICNKIQFIWSCTCPNCSQSNIS